jgi:hypothetical protein
VGVIPTPGCFCFRKSASPCDNFESGGPSHSRGPAEWGFALLSHIQ